MNFSVLVAFGGACLSGGLAISALFRDRRSFLYRVFALGMAALAAESVFSGFALQTDIHAELAHWQYLRLVAGSILPGCWLLFSLSYARENHEEFVRKWKWVVASVFFIPVCLVCLGSDQFFGKASQSSVLLPRGMLLGWSGYVYYIVFLLTSVMILAKLERTLRASYAKMRWRIKFMILGIGGLFAVRIYTASQVVLFHFVSADLISIEAGALVSADLLIILSLFRSHLRDVHIHVSSDLVRNSLAVLIVGFYLLAIGLSAKLARYLGIGETLLQNAFFVFLATVGLVVILLSEQLRHEIRRFLAHHFGQPLHDYRKVWTIFTQRTNALVDSQALCIAVVKTVSETFGCSSVSIWIVDEVPNKPVFCGSTFVSAAYGEDLRRNEKEVEALMSGIREWEGPVDLNDGHLLPALSQSRTDAQSVPEDTIRYCVPLAVGTEFLGLMTLNERMTGEPLSIEDLDLLKTIADQTAGLFLNCRLYDRLGHAKEKEAFHALSAFFVHDLKNVASTLSLTLQNLPLHYDNPEFRSDMLRVISRSLEKIEATCNRLAAFRENLELHRSESDLGRLVESTVAELNGSLGANLIQDLQPVPSVLMDCEQIQTVLVNLLLNANEATSNGGEIRLATWQEKDHAVLEVSDNGCGMSPAFLRQAIFHPFKTTKDRGLGIGLYQSKMIIEAHQGRIEVESEVGKGSTFRVLLPLKDKKS
jgi:putative PEP-CTERM system histidine kinase